MKKRFLILITLTSIFFFQCQEKNTQNTRNNTSSKIIDSLSQFIQQKTNLGQQDDALAQAHLELGSAYYKNDEYQNALKTYQKANTIWQQADAKRYLPNITDNYLNIASLLDALGDYPSAINYYKQALNSFLIAQDTALIVETYQNMAVAYLHTRNSSGIQFLEKGLFLSNKQYKPDAYIKAALLQCLGKANADYRRNYTASLSYFQQALPAYKTDSANLAETFIEMAKTYAHQNKDEMALLYAHKSLDIRQQVAKNKTAECYRVLGDIVLKQQKVDSALFFYQKALQSLNLDPTFQTNDVLRNPTIHPKTINQKVELIDVLAQKAGPLSILYQKTNDLRYLQAAFDTYQLADATIQAVRREMNEDASKYFWNETALPIYKKGIDAAYQLFVLTKDPKYKYAVLQFSERTKAPVLRENIADNQAQSFAGLPAQERQHERALRATIAILEKNSANDAATTTLLARTRTQLYAFQDSLKTRHPTYARYLDALTSNDTPLPTVSGSSISINSLKNHQNQLSDSTLLIEYAFGNTDLYAIALSKTDFQIFKTPITADFDKQLDRFSRSVSDVDALKKDFVGTGRDYAETSFRLYELLLQTPLTAFNAPKTIKRIHLVLEGKLHLLPFKALTDTRVTGWNGDYPKHFLVRKYAFGSLFSIQSLIAHRPSPNHLINNLGCFGLDFKDSTLWHQNKTTTGSGKKNDYLVNAETEVKNIATQFNGRFYFNQNATKSAFLKEAPQYDFLHITTHGYPEGLVFQKTNSADSSHEVSIGDIYGLQLHTRITFLSACETGQGKLTEAEGVMSLGRAFSLAGAQSVIMSLWSIPDGSTATIAQRFYTHYKAGMPKDVAAQRAEIAFLDKASDAQSHPNNWAALTIVGDMSPLMVEENGPRTWIWWALGVVTLLAFLWKRYGTSEINRH